MKSEAAPRSQWTAPMTALTSRRIPFSYVVREAEPIQITGIPRAALVAFSFTTTLHTICRLSTSCVLEFGMYCMIWACRTGHFPLSASPTHVETMGLSELSEILVLPEHER